MKIAFIGIRGIPIVYSGFETFAENLAVQLVKENYKVSVYCRSPYISIALGNSYKGVNLIVLPTIKSKNFETIIHSFLSTLHACFLRRYEVIYYFGVGNAIFTLLPKLLGIKTIINVDGLDWKREKWDGFAKWYLKYSEYLATKIPDVIISDSLYIQQYYQKNYKKRSIFIPYSFRDIPMSPSKQFNLLKTYSIEKRMYFIWVGRIIPDYHVEDFIIAYKRSNTSLKCMIIGDDLYGSPYKKYVYDLAKNDKRIIFTGYIDRKKLYALERNCFSYVETKRSGSTHQSLVDALGLGCFIIANDYHVNRQILKSSVVYYEQRRKDADLTKVLRRISECKNDKQAQIYRLLSRKLYEEQFSDKHVVNNYRILFKQLVKVT